MIKFYLALSICFLFSMASGQHLNYTRFELLRAEGLKISSNSIDNQYEDIQGLAFSPPQWSYASVTTIGGQRYDSLKVKFDIYANKLYSKINDTIYDITTGSVTRCTIYPAYPDTTASIIFQKGFLTADSKPDRYMEVLAYGRLTFLKQRVLQVKEVHEDSFLATVKKFVSQDYYYIIRKGQGSPVRLNKSAMEQQLQDKWKEVNQYMKAKNLSASNQEGWTALINFYNTLKREEAVDHL